MDRMVVSNNAIIDADRLQLGIVPLEGMLIGERCGRDDHKCIGHQEARKA